VDDAGGPTTMTIEAHDSIDVNLHDVDSWVGRQLSSR